MSSKELKDKIYSIIERHETNDAWLASVFHLLENAARDANQNWWTELSTLEQQQLDQSIAAAQRGEYISNAEVLDGL